MLNLSSNSSSELQHSSQSLKLLIYKHPFAFCGCLWVALVLLGGVATLGLVNPGPTEKGGYRPLPPLTTFEAVTPKPPTLKIWKKSTLKPSPITSQQEPRPKPSPLTSQPDSAPEQSSFTSQPDSAPQQDFPLWLFGAVALGCAGGSYLVTQLLKYSAQGLDNPKRLKPVGMIRKKRPNPSTKTSRSIPREPQQAGSQPNVQSLNKPVVTPNKNLTQVTVLPPEQSHPLDGGRGRENLAEMMDLRKRCSLSSLMRNK